MSNTPYTIGTNAAPSGSAALVITVTTSTSANDLIYIAANTPGSGTTISNITDSQGNSYKQVASQPTGTLLYEWVSSGATKALSSAKGDTVTVTYSGTGASKSAVVIGISGVMPNPDSVPTPVTGTSATSGSITSATLAEPKEVVIAAISLQTAGGNPVWGGGFTQIAHAQQTGAPQVAVAYNIVSATTAVTASATFSAANFAMEMATFIVPQPSYQYLVGQAAAPAGSPAIMTVPVLGTVANGDTIMVGALATAGSVTGVTDTAGNTYTAVGSQTTNTGCQLYTFAAYDANPMHAGLAYANAGRVGSTITTGNYGSSSLLAAANTFDTNTNEPMGLSSQKIYYPVDTFPTSTSYNGSDLLPLAQAGCQFWLCYQPDVDGSDLAAFQASLQFWLTLTPNIKVVMWQEPQDPMHGLTAATYAQSVAAYAPMIHSLGLKVIYDAAGSQSAKWVSWYPGNQYIDEIAVDFYGNTYDILTAQGQTDPLLPLKQLADSNGKPFGIGEIGQAVAPATTTHAQFIAYINYVQTTMQQRLANGLPNSDVMWYNGPNSANINTIVQGDWRVPYLQALYNAIVAQPVSVMVTYSTITSAQAVVAVGDNNVAQSSDIVIGATATTGSPSVTTGTLGQAEEHITAFFADVAAGGAPAVGDGMYTLATLEADATAYLAAGMKTVSTTTSDTPSATITSATWSIEVITNKVVLPVITSLPAEGYVGEAYSQTMMAVGGVGALTWGTTGGTLPPGLALTPSTGVIAGTPTTAGVYPFTLTATDSLGLQGTLAVSISILPAGGAGGAPAMSLPTNILSAADCDFETGTPTWAPVLNATTPAPTTAISIAGTHSLAWNASTGGTTQIQTGFYPTGQNLPYIASGFLITPGERQVSIGIGWYDQTHTLIDVLDTGQKVWTVPGAWLPLTLATVSPQGTAYAKLVVTGYSVNAGDVFNVELMFLTQSDTQVLVDWTYPTYTLGGAAGSGFMDVSPWLRMDVGVNYTRGRQDAISEIQPGSASYELQSNNGEFTRFSTAAIPFIIGGAVTTQRRCQVNFADEGGQWWTRFDGPLSEIEYTFDNPGQTSVAQVTVTDVFGFLNRQDPLFCWTKEQVLADNPLYHWTLDDPGNLGGSGVAAEGGYGVGAETSGSNGPPLRLSNSDSTKTATIAWQDTSSGVETLADAATPLAKDGSEFWTTNMVQPSSPARGLDSGTTGPYTTPVSSILVTPVQTAQSAQNTFIGNTGYMLSAQLPKPIGTNVNGTDWTIESWFTMDTSISAHLGLNYGPYVALGIGSSRTYANLLAGLFLNSGALKIECAAYSQPPAFRGKNFSGTGVPTPTGSTSAAISADAVKLPHHMIIVIVGDPSTPTVYFYLDNSLVGTFNLPKGQIYDTVCVGGAYGGTGSWFGNLSMVSVYPYALSAGQIANHCQLGQYGMWETTSDNCIAQIGSYAGIPSFWSNIVGQNFGLTMTEYMDITGSNAMTAMQLYEQAEAGLLFVDSLGALTFHTRDWRMGYGPPDLSLPPDCFDGDLQYALTDQFQCNEMAVSGPSTLGASAPIVGTTQNALSTGPTNTTTSAVLQASFVNTGSQQQYGVYAPNPISAPLALPLITWSRAFAQLGIPSFTYVPDPNLTDRAAWAANSRSDPWLRPAQVKVDLLTLDPNTGLAISSFYGLEVDNMITPSGTLPASFPNNTGSTEWFIEGISETRTLTEHTLTLFTSPAQSQRAWVPGDPTYGVLGSTTRLGISQADLSAVQADGKDVAHDGGGPYWPPVFSTSMNNPDQVGTGFIGAADMRGVAANLAMLLAPPMCVVAANQDAQSMPTGSNANPAILWDALYVDTTGGMGLVPNYPNWYCVTIPGLYEIDASIPWAATSSQSGYTGLGWIVVAQGAAQAIATGTGTPTTVSQFIAPVGEAVRFNSSSMEPVCAPSTRMYLGLGDMVGVAAEQNYSGALSTTSTLPGCMLSLRWLGIGHTDDRTEVNSSIANGGTVTVPVKGVVNTVAFTNTHTYSYQGQKGFTPYARRNTDQGCYQGVRGTFDAEGSQAAQIAFNASAISSALTGHQVHYATLSATNITSWNSTGATLMLGTTTTTPGGTSFHPLRSGSTTNLLQQAFQQGQALTFAIPLSIVTGFVSSGTQALIIGDSQTTNLNFYGEWDGGPGAWTLTVVYT